MFINSLNFPSIQTPQATTIYDQSEREKTKSQCEHLKQQVQQITKNAVPFARIVEFLREDMDSMLKELDQWRDEYAKNCEKMQEEMAKESEDKALLQNQLSQLDNQIKEKRKAIRTIKGQLIANDDKFNKIIMNMVK